MNIAIVGTKGIPASYGGVEKVVEELAAELADLGHSVTVFSRSYYSSIKKDEFSYKNFLVINISALVTKRLDVLSHSLFAAFKAARGDYDIVAFHSTVPGFFAWIPWLYGKKVYLHSHGVEVISKKWNWLDKLIMKWSIRFTSKVFTRLSIVSYDQKKYAQEIYNREFLLIENGINLIPSHTITVKKKQVLFVGRLVPDKGVELLIDAFNSIEEYIPDFELVIIGENSYTNNYFNLIKNKAEKNKNIKFVGAKYGKELITYYQESYCIVIPSRVESFSLVLLEALYYNGAVISSDIAQIKYLAKDFVDYFEDNSFENLASILLRWLESPDYAEEKRLKSSQFPYENYSWKKIANQYLEMYQL